LFDIKAKNNRIAKNIDYSTKKFENRSDFFNKSAEEYKEQVVQFKLDFMESDTKFKKSELELLQANLEYDNAYTLKHQANLAYNNVKKNRKLKIVRNKIAILEDPSIINNFTKEAIELKKIQLEDELEQVSKAIGLDRKKEILSQMTLMANSCKEACNSKAVITNSLKQIKKQKRLEYEVAISRTQPFSVKFFKSLRSFFGAK
jgi:hypothetical protein